MTGPEALADSVPWGPGTLAAHNARPGSALHGTFALEVTLDAAVSAVFAAFEQPALRHRWIRLPGTPAADDGRAVPPGGLETLRSTVAVGDRIERIERRTRFLRMVPDRQVIFTYEAHVDDRCRWLSLVTVELDPERPRTRLVWTEQYAFLEFTADGQDDAAHLRGGTRLQLTGLALALGATPHPASSL